MMDNQIKFFTVQDIFNEQDKQQPADVTKKYDPLHFWEDFGDRYYRGMEKSTDLRRNIPWLVHTIKMLGIKTLLDVGCSFCRVEPFLIDGAGVEHVTAIDISPKQLESAQKYLADYPQKDKIKIDNQSIKSLPYDKDSFDCVLGNELYTHLKPSRVNTGLRAMRKATKKYIILIERMVTPGEHPYPHIWSQEYIETAGNCGLKILQAKMIGNATVGLVLEK